MTSEVEDHINQNVYSKNIPHRIINSSNYSNNSLSFVQHHAHDDHSSPPENMGNSFADMNERFMQRSMSQSQSPENRGSQSLSPPKYRARSFDDNNSAYMLGDSTRVSRITQAERIIRQEMFKECTFRPTIKSLPSSYGAMKDSGTPFHARVTKWSKDKDADIRKKTMIIEKNEIAECTFRPKISRNSERAIREMRGTGAREDVSDRLYKSSSMYAEQRYRLIEEERVREDSEEKSQCTFQPKLFTKRFNETNSVNAKFARPVSASSVSFKAMQNETIKDHSVKECTFTPQINKIKPNMNSAKLYVSANVVERLTRPNPNHNNSNHKGDESMRAFDTSFVVGDTANGSRGNAVMDVASFLSNLTQTPANNNGRESNEQKENGGGVSEDEILERQKKFETFLHRQQQIVKRKEDHIRMITQATAPKFQPKLSKKSIEIGEEKFSNIAFLDRVDKDVQKRLSSEQFQSVALEKECTFQPKINEKSEKLRPRSAFELSRGDLFRKETNRRMLQMQTEQMEQAALTFQPQLSSYAQSMGRSKLQLNSGDPSQFLDWYKEKTNEKENQRQQEMKRREEEASKDCTFSPKTIDCPEYVRRIARSMSIVKNARVNADAQSVGEPERPEWR